MSTQVIPDDYVLSVVVKHSCHWCRCGSFLCRRGALCSMWDDLTLLPCVAPVVCRAARSCCLTSIISLRTALSWYLVSVPERMHCSDMLNVGGGQIFCLSSVIHQSVCDAESRDSELHHTARRKRYKEMLNILIYSPLCRSMQCNWLKIACKIDINLSTALISNCNFFLTVREVQFCCFKSKRFWDF